MRQDGICQPQIPLGVLEVDGVNLVWHGRRTHLSGHDLLLQITHGHVEPDVAIQVEQNLIPPLQRVEQLRHAVVALDLRGERVLREAERLNNALGECHPVDLWRGGVVRIIVADGSIHLRGEDDGVNLPGLTAQAMDKDCQFFPERRRACRLPVGMGEHGQGDRRLGERSERIRELVAFFPEDGEPVSELKRVRHVVDVLGGAGEVHELTQRRGAVFRQLLADEILHGFHVVARGRFNLLNALSVLQREGVGNRLNRPTLLGSERGGFGKRGFIAKREQPRNFHAHPPLDQPEL